MNFHSRFQTVSGKILLYLLLILQGFYTPAFAQASPLTENHFTDTASGPVLEAGTENQDAAAPFIDLPSLEDPFTGFMEEKPLAKPGAESPAVTPESNDPYSKTAGTWGQNYLDLWWHDRVRAEEAWAFTRGQGTTVAVIDSGVDTSHPELSSNTFKNILELNGLADVDDDGNGYIDDIFGWDLVNGDNNPQDTHGHGTHVAGIIGAAADNLTGIAGIAPGAVILPLRVLDETGRGFFSHVSAAIRYAADLGVHVINMSLGALRSETSQSSIDALQSAIEYAAGKGSVVVAAAGNSSSPVGGFVPASLTNVISVGSSAPDNTLSGFSNFGPDLDITAPGSDVLSLKSRESSCTLCGQYDHLIVGSDYLRLSGTSMASPMVAGAVALMRAFDPLMTLADIERRLRYSARDLGATGYDNVYGAGLLDIFTALSTDYYDTGALKTRFLAQADQEGVKRFDYDLLGRISRKTFTHGGYADLTYWPATSTRFEQIYFDAAGTWMKTEEYFEDGVTLHFVRFPDGRVIEYGGPTEIPLTLSSKSSGWTLKDGDDWMAGTGNKYLIYNASVPAAGDYTVNVEAKNFANDGWKLPSTYTHFRLNVTVDDVSKGTLLVPASDLDYKTGTFKLTGLSAGNHTIKITWTNDSYNSTQKTDANIQVNRAWLTGEAAAPPPPNEIPAASNVSVTLDEDSGPKTFQLLGTDADTGDTLSYSLVSPPQHGTVSCTGAGLCTYTPEADYNGPDSFTYKVNDGKADSNIATASITVNPVDEPPVNEAPVMTLTSKSGGWTQQGEDWVAYTGNKFLSYTADLPESRDYVLKLEAKNFVGTPGWKLPSSYTHFRVNVTVDGVSKGTLLVPASNTEYRIGSFNLTGLSAGPHTIKLTWLNDSYSASQMADANIQVHQAWIE
jgi:subtilisin family serine protease